MSTKLIISAYNIHQGGGKVLLTELLRGLDKDQPTCIFIDSRLHIPKASFPITSKVILVKPSFYHRFMAEVKIKQTSNDFTHLLCFGNLPPIFTSELKTIIYVQNKYLISKNFICFQNIKSIFRSLIEKFLFEAKKSKNYHYLVQTQSMKRTFEKNQKQTCTAMPFAPNTVPKQKQKKSVTAKVNSKFIYVASGEPHKNHKRLVEAWIYLSQNNGFPQLTLVLNSLIYPDISTWVQEKIRLHNLNIHLINSLSTDELTTLYQEQDALIFPSLFESFGLPLLEATEAKLPIISAELDYIRDIVTPVETFDPTSFISIARAMARFLNIPLGRDSDHLLNGKEFIQSVLKY